MEAKRPYGVLGRVLGHSYTPVIYHALAGLDYRKFEREPQDIESFLKGDEWEGVNVTIPYKRDVMSYLDELSRRRTPGQRQHHHTPCRRQAPWRQYRLLRLQSAG